MFNTMDIILKNLNPDFEKEYNDHIIKELWSTDEFSALTQRLLPKRYKEIVDENFDLKQLSSNERKQALAAMKLNNKLLLDIENKKIENVYFIEKETLISAGKCIKWLVETQTPIKKMFFKALPLSLMELYIEFQPINNTLRNGEKKNPEYHRAYYIRAVEKLIKQERRPMKPKEIYNHLKGVQHYLRELGCRAKKRTVIELWIPKAENYKKNTRKAKKD
ncbi:MAG: hypothetical protein K1060chlam1_01169 [Candidatus Anoxychlamydiales bacterium]|nr:hypothetical protein [Candidatus Anoxychlamydiales bacterium]